MFSGPTSKNPKQIKIHKHHQIVKIQYTKPHSRHITKARECELNLVVVKPLLVWRRKLTISYHIIINIITILYQHYHKDQHHLIAHFINIIIISYQHYHKYQHHLISHYHKHQHHVISHYHKHQHYLISMSSTSTVITFHIHTYNFRA